LGNNLFSQLKDNIIPSLGFLNSAEISSIVQLLMLIGGIDKEFYIYEELVDIHSIEDTETGGDIFKTFKIHSKN